MQAARSFNPLIETSAEANYPAMPDLINYQSRP